MTLVTGVVREERTVTVDVELPSCAAFRYAEGDYAVEVVARTAPDLTWLAIEVQTDATGRVERWEVERGAGTDYLPALHPTLEPATPDRFEAALDRLADVLDSPAFPS